MPASGTGQTCTAVETQFGCTVSISGSPGSQGPGGNPTPGGPGGNTGGGGSGGGPVDPVPCTYVAAGSSMSPPAGAGPGQYEFVYCGTGSQPSFGGGIVWVPDAGTPPPPPPPPDPATVAAQAASELTLPAPTIGRNPASFALVNFPEWLWVDAAIWHAFSTTATACNAGGCVSATATAIPQSLYFSTGDGAGVTCTGPGAAYDPGRPEDSQSTTCTHTYLASSLGQPSPDGNPNDDAFRLSATVTWSVTWSASGAASGAGSLGDLTTSSSTTLRVEQVESVISGG